MKTFGAKGLRMSWFVVAMLATPLAAFAQVPGAPTIVAATPGNKQVTVSWEAGDGGPATGFTVTASPGGATCSVAAPAASCTVSGLENGTQYNFVVTASNAEGTSPASDAYPARPVYWSAFSLSGHFRAVAWNGSTWMLVGSGGVISASENGVDLISQTSGTNQQLNAVAWNGSMWMAVGASGTILTSTNGTDWTSRASGTTESLTSVAWNGRMWAAGTMAGSILTSPDGSTWTLRSTQSPNRVTALAWNGSKWVAAGHEIMRTSTDGIMWTEVPLSGMYMNAVAWNGSTWLAVGRGGRILASPDGVNWTTPATAGNGELFAVVWSGREWQVTGLNVTYVSADGSSWTPNGSGLVQSGGTAATLATWMGLAWGNRRYITVGAQVVNSGRAAVPDTLPAAPSGLGYGGDVFVLITNADTTLAPTLTGNAVTWSVSPSLPAGLWLDPVTGAIRGAATAVLAPTAYTVTARNMGGAATKVLTLAVENAGKPKGLAYEPASRSFPVGIEIEPWVPTLESGEPTGWSIEPALPAGLVFDPETGEIFGAPSELSPLQEYVVKAARGTDTASAVIQIEVVEVVALRPEAFTIRVTGREKSYGFTIPAGVVGVDRVTVGILDVHGRTLWSASVTPKPGKAQEIVWNGRARNGSLVSAGVYVVRVSVTGDGKTTHFTRKTVSLKPGGR